MQSILNQGIKELMKVKAKSEKLHGRDDSPIVILENTLPLLKQKESDLKMEIFRDEGTYISVAQEKRERKLKTGVNEQNINQYQKIIDGSKMKLEQKKEMIHAKIEKLDADKKTMISQIEAKIEKLEADKRAIISQVEAKIEKKLEKDIEYAESMTQKTISYHQDLIDKAYEDAPVVVAYPPSHHKKKEELRMVQSQIESTQKQIIAMKAAEFDNAPRESPHDQKLRRLREQAEREGAEELRLARQAQEEQEYREAMEKKKLREAEEERVRKRREERERAFQGPQEATGDTPSATGALDEETEEEEGSQEEQEQEEWLKQQDAIRAAQGKPPLPRFR